MVTPRSIEADLPPPLTLACSGKSPAVTSDAGVAVTAISPVLLGLTLTLVAWAWPDGLAVTVHPGGPVASIVNAISAAVSLWIVTLNVNVVSAGPRWPGESVLSVTLPAAASATRIDSGSTAVSPPPVAVIVIVFDDAVAASGISTSSVRLGGFFGST